MPTNQKEYMRRWRQINREKLRVYFQVYRKTHPKEVAEYQRRYEMTHRDRVNTLHREYRKEHRKRKYIPLKQYYRNIGKSKSYTKINRTRLIGILGTVCVICGFNDIRALQIDHKNGGGHQDQKRHGKYETMLRYYIKHPDDAMRKLQILCANCNYIKRAVNDENYRRFLNPLNIKYGESINIREHH